MIDTKKIFWFGLLLLTISALKLAAASASSSANCDLSLLDAADGSKTSHDKSLSANSDEVETSFLNVENLKNCLFYLVKLIEKEHDLYDELIASQSTGAQEGFDTNNDLVSQIFLRKARGRSKNFWKKRGFSVRAKSGPRKSNFW